MKSKSLKAALTKFNVVKKENPADFEALNQKEVGTLRGGVCTCFKGCGVRIMPQDTIACPRPQ